MKDIENMMALDIPNKAVKYAATYRVLTPAERRKALERAAIEIKRRTGRDPIEKNI